MEKVSVVIPAHNAGRWIDETLRSVMAQSYPNLEVIVVDDGSTDNTREIIERYGSVRYHYQPCSGAASSPRNTGVKLSTGSVIAFLDADDLWTAQKVEREVAFMADADMVLSNYQNFDSQRHAPHFSRCKILQKIMAGAFSVLLEPVQLRRLLPRENLCMPSSLMIRRRAFDAIGGFNEALRGSEDFEFVYRVALKTDRQVAVLQDVGSLRRLHDCNMSSQTQRMLEAQIFSRSCMRAIEPDAQARKWLRHYLHRVTISMGCLHARRGNVGPTRMLARQSWPLARSLGEIIDSAKLTARGAIAM